MRERRYISLMDAIQLCNITKAYTDIYVLFCTWRHVSAAHTAIFRPAYNRTGPFMCAQYGIPHCLHMKYMWNKYICKTYNYMWLKRQMPEFKYTTFSLLIKSKLLQYEIHKLCQYTYMWLENLYMSAPIYI